MPGEQYHIERHYAHKKWLKRHRIITLVSIISVVGVLWAWVFAIKWYSHWKSAKRHRHMADISTTEVNVDHPVTGTGAGTGGATATGAADAESDAESA